jgi:hypothetical protein
MNIDWSLVLVFLTLILTSYLGLRKEKRESKVAIDDSESKETASDATAAEIYQRLASAVGIEKLKLITDAANEKAALIVEINKLREDVRNISESTHKQVTDLTSYYNSDIQSMKTIYQSNVEMLKKDFSDQIMAINNRLEASDAYAVQYEEYIKCLSAQLISVGEIPRPMSRKMDKNNQETVKKE